MVRVLLAFPLADPAAEERLARAVEVVRTDGGDQTAFVAALADVDGVILRPPARLDAEALAAAPALRVIANIGTGLDHIDTARARERGIAVAAGSAGNARAVAEWVVCAMIMVSRRIDAAMTAVRDPDLRWASRVATLRGHEIGGRTLGIIGFGAVGRELAGMARGLGMHIAAYDPFQPPEGVDHVCSTLDELLDASQIVSLHVPLTEQTRNLIGRAELDRLGASGVLINSARGGVVDEEAVVTALREGRLRGAAWDVFAREPPSPGRIIDLAAVPGLVLTPHIAGISYEAGAALAWHAVDSVLAALGPAP